MLRHRRDGHPLLLARARRVLGDDGEDDVVLVQHLVVLEIVQQRGRREFGIAGEEHRGARHDMRRLLLQAVQQRFERHLGLARLVGEDAGAAPPGQDQHHHEDAEQQRHPGAFQQLEQVGREERGVDEHQRHHQQRGLPGRPSPQLPDHDEAQHAVDHHGGGDRDAIGGGKRIRGVEQADQQHDAEQQRGVDARNVDLPGIFRRGVHDGEPRQEAELDRLAHQRIGAGDDGLARDHGRGGGEHDQRQQQRFGHQPIERILDGLRMRQHQRALAEIVDQQRRQHEPEPGALDRLAAEMAEIGIERLAAGDGQEHRAERDQADVAVGRDEADGIDRIDGRKHREVVAKVHGAGDRDGDEPDQHHRAEEARDPRGAAALHREQHDQDDDGERQHVVLHRRRREFEALHRRQHRDRRRDHRVAEEHRRADDAEQQQVAAPAERAGGERGQRQRAALAVVVGAQQHQHVFDRHHDHQRPHDQRQHAEHRVARHRTGFGRRQHRDAEGVERACADVAIDHADAAERQRPDASAAMRSGLGRDRGAADFAHHVGHVTEGGFGCVATSRGGVIRPCAQYNNAWRQLLAMKIVELNQGFRVGRQGRRLAHQRDRDAAVGRNEGIVRKQRLGVGPARDHEHARGRHAFFFQDLANGIGAVGRQFPRPIARWTGLLARRGVAGDDDAVRQRLERPRQPLHQPPRALVGFLGAFRKHRAAVLIDQLDVEALLGLLDHDLLRDLGDLRHVLHRLAQRRRCQREGARAVEAGAEVALAALYRPGSASPTNLPA